VRCIAPEQREQPRKVLAAEHRDKLLRRGVPQRRVRDAVLGERVERVAEAEVDIKGHHLPRPRDELVALVRVQLLEHELPPALWTGGPHRSPVIEAVLDA
jgi:hypothetical protein